MRFFLVLAGIIAMGWYGWSSFKGNTTANIFSSSFGENMLKPKEAPAAVHSPSSASGGAVNTPPPRIGGNESASGFGGSPGRPPLPTASQTVQLLNRDLPGIEWFSPWASAGINLIPDPVTRSVTITGQPVQVSLAAESLKRLDQQPGYCALQAWCVYVDSSIQKGWDLVAAIGAASNGDMRIKALPGAVTLNLGNDEIAAAMQLIADGVSVEVVQNPYVRLTHLAPALIEAIQEFPVPQTTVSNGLAQTSIEFRKVGLQFSVNPRFLGANRVALEVKQTNGVVGTPVEVNGNKIPVVDTQTVSSTVELEIGQGIVLGGVRTSRLRHAKGWLRDRVEHSEGVLYVVLSTSSEIPRARPVNMGLDAPEPLGGIGDPMILPPRDPRAPWQTPDGVPVHALPLPTK